MRPGRSAEPSRSDGGAQLQGHLLGAPGAAPTQRANTRSLGYLTRLIAHGPVSYTSRARDPRRRAVKESRRPATSARRTASLPPQIAVVLSCLLVGVYFR